MQRRPLAPRADWQAQAADTGFDYHTIDGAPYWDESVCYQFDWRQIEDQLETATEDLHELALALVPEILASEELLTRLSVPPLYWDYLARSWSAHEPQLYGRMDLAYDGSHPPKLLELNYDTPTSLFESGFFQWNWLEQQVAAGALPAAADQFNSIQEKLIEAFESLVLPEPLWFSCVDDSSEDRGNTLYLLDCATQAGLVTRYLPLDQLAERDGQFAGPDGAAIHALFKLYPWEFMLAEEFGPVLLTSSTRFLEPPWKLLLSNKGVLPLLWERHRGHPNLLEAHFDAGPGTSLAPGWVRKPVYSREGANIEMRNLAGQQLAVSGPYTEGPWVRQRFQPLPRFDAADGSPVYTVVGSWVIGDRAAGLGIREDATPITRNTSRFVPHFIHD